jgi:hypothetical protein
VAGTKEDIANAAIFRAGLVWPGRNFRLTALLSGTAGIGCFGRVRFVFLLLVAT